ncbi:nucleoside-triphosphatase [Chloroflexota bacterium]
MVIIVTGGVGAGKTTVCSKLISVVRNKGITCGGILTYKAIDKSITIEDIQSGEKETLASISKSRVGPRTPRYFFNQKGIDFGIKAIERGTSAEILVIDEVGQLELGGEGFTNVFELINSEKVQDCIIVIRSALLTAFQTQFDTPPLIFETTINNRDKLPFEIASVLLEKLR